MGPQEAFWSENGCCHGAAAMRLGSKLFQKVDGDDYELSASCLCPVTTMTLQFYANRPTYCRMFLKRSGAI